MISENDPIPANSFKAWVLAARPKTLAGAAVPVMIAVSLAWRDASLETLGWLPAVLCCLFAFLMQIDSNLINDYFDCVKGNDDVTTRLGPKRACAEGWITLPAMRRALVVTSLLACVAGLPLVYYGGLEMVLVGACCVIFAFLYTTFFSYHGLGDMLVLVFFGIVPVCATYYVVMPPELQTVRLDVVLISLGCGCVIDTLLCINNFRDRENDKRDGKITLIVRLGEDKGAKLYNAIGLAGVAITFAAIMLSCDNVAKAIGCAVPYLLYILAHSQSYKKLREIWTGKNLNQVLGMTARDMLVYGLMTVVSIAISII